MRPATRPATRRALILVVAAMLPLAAQARETERMLSVRDAVESEYAEGYLLQVPFYLKGQEGAPSGRAISTVTTEQTTNGAFRSDAKACRIAFLTALRRIQERAREAGGDAIVDLVSTTGDERTESATDFRCVAGALIVHVGLEGTVVDVE